MDGPPEYILSRVRGAFRLDDGRVVVADGGSSSIRFYGSDGAFLASSGGPGQGPGEYLDIGMIGRLPGDTIVVVNPLARRISILNPSGAHARSMSIASAEGFANIAIYNPVGLLDDGRMLAYASSGAAMHEGNIGKLILDRLQPESCKRIGERLTGAAGGM